MNPLDQSQIQRDSGLPPLDEAHVLARHAVLRCNLFPWAGGNADGFNDLVGVFGVPVRFASRNSFGVSVIVESIAIVSSNPGFVVRAVRRLQRRSARLVSSLFPAKGEVEWHPTILC